MIVGFLFEMMKMFSNLTVVNLVNILKGTEFYFKRVNFIVYVLYLNN